MGEVKGFRSVSLLFSEKKKRGLGVRNGQVAGWSTT